MISANACERLQALPSPSSLLFTYPPFAALAPLEAVLGLYVFTALSLL